MIDRILEPEVMDTAADAADYDAMDHADVNAAFAADFLSVYPGDGLILDVGTGTAQIPIELCRRDEDMEFVAVDLSQEMLHLAQRNIEAAGFGPRISLFLGNARDLPRDWKPFDAVISNSIIHHIPDPFECLAEMVRLCGHSCYIFVRDLMRPDSLDELQRLVNLHAAGANDHQRQLFADSLHAALTLTEMRSLVERLDIPPHSVQQTSDRHWTWSVSPMMVNHAHARRPR